MAEGNGEQLQIEINNKLGSIYKGIFKKSKFSETKNDIPQWQTPIFTDIFNSPFGLIDDIK